MLAHCYDSWIEIDAKFAGGTYYNKNSGWSYIWQVQHDVEGLIALQLINLNMKESILILLFLEK